LKKKQLIYYGVCGEGLGHYSRAVYLAPKLAAAGYKVTLFSSDRLCKLMAAAMPEIECRQIPPGFRFQYRANALDYPRTALDYLASTWPTMRAYRRIRKAIVQEQPAAAITDYEPVIAWAATNAGVPLLALDHQQVATKCIIPEDRVPSRALVPIRIANKMVLGKPRVRLITSFFHPEPLPPRDSTSAKVDLVGPLLRETVLERRPSPGEHIVVYQTSESLTWLGQILNELPGEKRVYGHKMPGGKNITVRDFDPERFLDDLASCRFAILNAGHTAISEAVYFGKPVICLPVRGQVEQEMNAAYVTHLGFGMAYTPKPGTVPDFADFFANEKAFRKNIAERRIPPGNGDAYKIVCAFMGDCTTIS
jgi:uncharacterized protein (TIGR00661 family)